MAIPTNEEAAMTGSVRSEAGDQAGTQPAPSNWQSSGVPPRVAVVTGGSQGLGEVLVAALVERGWQVVTDARRADRLAVALARLGAQAARVRAVPGDVTDEVHRNAVSAAAAAFGPVCLLVNNASTLGASPLPAVEALSPDVLRRIFEVNVVAPVALLEVLLPQLADTATIVNITSDAATEAYEGWGGYGASKAALEHLGRVLAAEHPSWRVLNVDPGDLRTEMHQDAFPGEDISDRPEPASAVPAFLALLESARPSGRYRLADLETDVVPDALTGGAFTGAVPTGGALTGGAFTGAVPTGDAPVGGALTGDDPVGGGGVPATPATGTVRP
jgi:NAD(P)-dependent dehydrogenase (short-subunit alcohol dehydrogenase family)